jgi:hypothetical protein
VRSGSMECYGYKASFIVEFNCIHMYVREPCQFYYKYSLVDLRIDKQYSWPLEWCVKQYKNLSLDTLDNRLDAAMCVTRDLLSFLCRVLSTQEDVRFLYRHVVNYKVNYPFNMEKSTYSDFITSNVYSMVEEIIIVKEPLIMPLFEAKTIASN